MAARFRVQKHPHNSIIAHALHESAQIPNPLSAAQATLVNTNPQSVKLELIFQGKVSLEQS